MAGRDKKDATTAMSQLQTYLRRDISGTRLLASITKYVGTLRTTQTALKAEAQSLQSRAKDAVECNHTLSQQVAGLSCDVAAERAARQQSESSLALANAKITELETMFDDADVGEVPFPLRDPKMVTRLLKRLRKQMKKPPQPTRKIPHINVGMFSLDSIVKGHTDAEYTLLGLFTTLACVMGMPIGFQMETAWDAKHPCSIDTTKQFVRWISAWIGDPKWREDIQDRTMLLTSKTGGVLPSPANKRGLAK